MYHTENLPISIIFHGYQALDMVNVLIFIQIYKSLRKRTHFDLGLGCAKDGDPHSESLFCSRTPSRAKRSISFLKISQCNYGKWIWSQTYRLCILFQFKVYWIFFQVPSVPSNNSSKFCNNFSNSLHFISCMCWHWFSITLFKSEFHIYHLKLHVIIQYKYGRVPIHILLLCNHS